MDHNILAICFDFGDTLVDESTEIKDEHQVTQQAELIPGAAEVLQALKARGYPLAIVSNGPVGNVYNVLSQESLLELFDALAISEALGVEKPAAGIFVHALDHLSISREDYGRTVMVGNHLEADVLGANRLGMISVWLDWAPRYPKTVSDNGAVPRHTIKEPLELLPLIDRLEDDSGAFRTKEEV
ncbi:MAG: HAD-IA family hydrolase [Anaerolineae bacterium]|nr:HAD-IA family hydrolase [Anaerolineae bacterium]